MKKLLYLLLFTGVLSYFLADLLDGSGYEFLVFFIMWFVLLIAFYLFLILSHYVGKLILKALGRI